MDKVKTLVFYVITSSIISACGHDSDNNKIDDKWVLVASESFDNEFTTDNDDWILDTGGKNSPWYIDELDDFGEVWHKISDPQFSKNLATLNIFRKRIEFGDSGWLTAEIAAQDKDADGIPDSNPKAFTVDVNGEKALKLDEPSWDSGILIRPTKPLPSRYRVEMTLRKIDFGGKRGGSFKYDGKFNGYTDPDNCKTNFPWTWSGSLEREKRCEYTPVKQENGFYYLTILDHANPSPQDNVGIHTRRKVIIDGYFSNASWSQNQAVCNPKTGELYGMDKSTFNTVNAIFPTDYKNDGFFFRTECGDFDIKGGPYGEDKQYEGVVSSAELQPELLPKESYTFAVERDEKGYTIEIEGPFLHSGYKKMRFSHEFVEGKRAIWHYNQTASEYDGKFDRPYKFVGYSGSYLMESIWPAGSSYPDSFIIGDPHVNYYEGSAIIDNIKLYVPREELSS
ncbi:hypothetical protein [Vibrio hepatarius]|uniref:hypothetical protein n=1 Tax=Vibrio hepatarius TaxID=171383 RepID=UPI00142DD173|nr:hypothetical protein [Vibrio hepatarius]NIY83709.1 hypothetical protein [Vibrio hepatarius]